MFATSKALNSNVRSIFSKIVHNNFSQSKHGQVKNSGGSSNIFYSESPMTNVNNMTKNIAFGITQAKEVSEVIHEVPVGSQLKKIQKTAEIAHCFNPRTHHEEDVPIRIFRTHYTVSFIPSVQFLQNEHSNKKHADSVYHSEKDSILSVYKFTCKNCGHHEARSFPENGFKFGTVITGCDQCHQVLLVSDHLGWVEPKKEKHSTDLIFSKKQVLDIIKRNLQKVGIDTSNQKQFQ